MTAGRVSKQRRVRHLAWALALALPAAAAAAPDPADEAALQARALRLAQDAIIVDGHIDAPLHLQQKWTDPRAMPERQFDGQRARAGGLDAPFMSIYIPARYQKEGGAKALADALIDTVERMAREAPEFFALARSPADVRRNHAAGKISLPMGMENGAGLEGELANLDHFHARGIRYITLTHAEPNRISDSSYSQERPHGGLSDFGRAVVARMNALGIMVDVSHISDAAFFDVLEVSAAPVVATHSSARHFTPGWERNMSDEMIRALAAHGGLIMVNFGSGFLTEPAQKAYSAATAAIGAFMKAEGIGRFDDPRLQSYIADYQREHPFPYATIDDVIAHIDHIVALTGIDHVGLGSDFDGLGDTLPVGLKSAADYPALVAALLERGYTEAQVRKILGENLLRLWSQVENAAAGEAPS
ncbi:MAG: dipeptidase [Pseudomonadota bacterium]